MRKQFVKTSMEIANNDDKLVILAGDIGVYSFRNFKDKFTKQYYNIGICEQTIIGIGAGLSLSGFFPVMHSITPFIVERCFEQIKDDFYYQQLRGTIISVGGTFDYSSLGCTHHSYSDIGLFRTLPKAEIFTPCDRDEFSKIYQYTYNNNKLTYIRITEHPVSILNGKLYDIYQGIQLSEGNDISIFVSGALLNQAKQIAETMKKTGINVDLCYFSSLQPIDEKLIVSSAIKTKKVITIEENLLNTGLGSIINNILAKYRNIVVRNFGLSDFIREYGTYDQLLELEGLNSKDIFEEIELFLDNHN